MTHVYNAFEFTARILDYSKPDLHGVDTKEMVNLCMNQFSEWHRYKLIASLS